MRPCRVCGLRMHPLRLASAVLAAAVCCAQLAHADNAAFEIVRDHIAYDVAADGSYVERQEKLFRILSPQGLDSLHQVNLSYTDGYQDAQIDAAYTIKRDGRRIDVPKDRFFVGSGMATSSGFHDQKTRLAVFENVEVGDEVGYVTEFRQKKPWYPGEFFTSFPLGHGIPLHDFQVTVDAPPSLSLRADAIGVQGGRLADSGSRQHWSWTFDSRAGFAPDGGSVSGMDGGPYLLISSFADYGALARAYEDGARHKAEPTTELRALADRLSSGARDRRDVARRIYNWVSSNIKYVSIVLGNGGLVPHSAAEVLRSGYGDCKDHVTLLQALLAARGIESSPVLINLSPSYRLPAAASPDVFNHLISYLPELDLYVDSTSMFAPFGELPIDDLDKPVLIVASKTLARTPTETAARATLHSTTVIQVEPDGSADAETQFAASGPLAADVRADLARVAPGGEGDYLRAALAGVIDGSLSSGIAAAAADTYSGKAHYRIENAANLMGPGAISAALGYSPRSLQDLIDARLPERHSSYICASFSDSQETVLRLPSNAVITYVPKDAEETANGMRFTAAYERLAGNAVRSVLTLKAEHPHMVCSAEYYNSIRRALGRMMGLASAQIVYEPAEMVSEDPGAKLAYAPCAARKCSSQ